MFRKSLGMALALTLFSVAHANEQEPEKKPVLHSLNYAQVGLGPFPLPIPVFGVGHREQSGHHGWDVSLQASTIVLATQVKGSTLYHYYPKPNLASQFYFGAGASVNTLYQRTWHHDRPKGFLSPEFVVGKQYKNEAGDTRFFQMQLSFPSFSPSNHNVFYMPLVVFSYGICF